MPHASKADVDRKLDYLKRDTARLAAERKSVAASIYELSRIPSHDSRSLAQAQSYLDRLDHELNEREKEIRQLSSISW